MALAASNKIVSAAFVYKSLKTQKWLPEENFLVYPHWSSSPFPDVVINLIEDPRMRQMYQNILIAGKAQILEDVKTTEDLRQETPDALIIHDDRNLIIKDDILCEYVHDHQEAYIAHIDTVSEYLQGLRSTLKQNPYADVDEEMLEDSSEASDDDDDEWGGESSDSGFGSLDET